MYRIIFLATLLISGCGAQQVKDDVVLKVDDGVIILKARCSGISGSISINKVGRSAFGAMGYYTSPAVIKGCNDDEQIFSFKLKHGHYYISQVIRGNSSLNYDDDSAYTFMVKPQLVNYIGDLVVSGGMGRISSNGNAHHINLRMYNKFDSFEYGSEENMKGLPKGLPLVNSTAKK